MFTPLLLAFGSGAAALIYEVVWFQMLELEVGSTSVALGILLATFMGGMCLGSLIFPRVVSAQRNAFTAYAIVELGMAICGLFALLLVPLAGGVAGAIACLLPPTILMGATLPALSRVVDEKNLGVLYGANIAGGVAGCLLAGFYLLRVHDVAVATYVAVAVNVVIAVIGQWSRPSLFVGCLGSEDWQATKNDGLPHFIPHLVIGISGLCALGSEAIWTRNLSLLFGGSVYTFSIILAVFLTGLGIGSLLVCRVTRPLAALGWCQVLAALAMAWAGHAINGSLPYWPIDPSLTMSIWHNFALDLDRAFWAVLPATVLWGASFPLALAAVRGADPARIVAGIYSANTVGAIIGALGASLVLVGWVGSQRAEQVLIALSVLGGVLLLGKWQRIAAVAACLSVLVVPPIPGVLIAHGRYSATWIGKGEIPFAKEGTNSSVAVSTFSTGAVTFHVAGKIQASNVPRDMRLQRMLGHLTTLTVAHPDSVLVIGCGAGITAGAVSIDPRVQRETIAEIEPLVPEAAAKYFGEANFDVLKNPKVELRIGDGRHFLLDTQQKFDGITIDPLDPWVKGAANLYTKEFYEAMRRHLNPGGSVTMYVQLFETNLDAVKSLVATFFDVFPNGTIWGNPYQGRGHDMVLLGQAEPLRIDLDEMETRFGYRDDTNKIPQSLAEVEFSSPVDLFATYAGRASDLEPWLEGAAINRDRNLRMQYLAGFGLNRDDSEGIYAQMLLSRKFPEDIFSSKEGRLDSLRRALAR